MDEETPSICEQCLTDADLRMTRAARGAECKICTLPFTLYHFKPPGAPRVTKTLVCRRCAAQRNVCQCCMLDLAWKLPVALRDELVSLVQGSDERTPEASNEMVRRFLALRGGQLGGARLTADSAPLRELMGKMRAVAAAAAPAARAHGGREDAGEVPETQLPFGGALATPASRSFFIYGVDPALPEWELVDAVSQLVRTPDWRDAGSVSVVVRQDARCAGIRFRREELAQAFVARLETLPAAAGAPKGVLRIRHLRMHVVAWPEFHLAAFGETKQQTEGIARLATKTMRADAEGASPARPAAPASAAGKVAKKAAAPRRQGRRGPRPTLEL
ncbi:AGR032Wp [Eremothecium gossypii ATCC 10895]|uniref:Pre-mRNA-splicing factor SLT11 n=1 Tax=Eremothecium gossypii (strain ATCC 10895 / CBS 109.51 / FGSC 9923 / NRRL Y-1056) TaxID=284811 RepID=SLT11_EREGS|nr:AGR032Wp [Eremothecium gossypii ATCC 10895]Q750K9.1 RecName: Full=Pre-mRNA-splicing factor SLT11 [Eremothecium gossypii ATCC 10895]AAS54521.1 AGR032Wp [Eremothecium gossypii ATCC 10895]AEY98853.1 FAGR032Wp [Eremothecium gossypii FDAG1]